VERSTPPVLQLVPMITFGRNRLLASPGISLFDVVVETVNVCPPFVDLRNCPLPMPVTPSATTMIPVVSGRTTRSHGLRNFAARAPSRHDHARHRVRRHHGPARRNYRGERRPCPYHQHSDAPHDHRHRGQRA